MDTTSPVPVHNPHQRPGRYGQRPVPPQRQRSALGRWSAKEAVMSSHWFPKPIHALDSPTDLGFVVGVSRWKAIKLAQAGKWQQDGIYITSTCSKYRVAAQQPLQMPGYGDLANSASERTHPQPTKSGTGNARDDAVKKMSRPVPGRGRL